MKYSILWFEDEEDYIETHEETLRDYLKGLGFELLVTPKIDDGNLEEVLRTSQADLILIDYHLSTSDDDTDDPALMGDNVVKRIRECNLLVETILYSRDPLFPANITNEKFEGVYFANDVELPEKAIKIINLTIKKQQEISNLRGLFIAEAIDIATQMEEIIVKILNLRTPARIDLFRYNIMHAEFFNDYAKYSFIQTILKQKQKILNEVANGGYKKEDKEKANRLKEMLDPLVTTLADMEKEVIVQRNYLAHSKPTEDNIGLICKGKIVKLDDTMCKTIRANFLKHTENLKEIEKNIEAILNIETPEPLK